MPKLTPKQERCFLKRGYLVLMIYTIAVIIFNIVLRTDVILPAPLQSVLFLFLILSVLGSGNAVWLAIGIVVTLAYLALLVPTLLSPLRRSKKNGFFHLLHFACVLDVIASVIILLTGEYLIGILNILLDLLLLFSARRLKAGTDPDQDEQSVEAEAADSEQ